MVDKVAEISEIKEYDKLSRWREKELEKLESEKQKHLNNIEKYQTVQEQLELLLNERDDLYEQRDDLKQEFEDAQFEDDSGDTVAEIRNRKQKIDERIDAIESARQDFDKWLSENAVDPEAVARTVVSVMLLEQADKPSLHKLKQAVTEAYEAVEKPLQEQAKGINAALFTYAGSSEIDKVRRQMDSKYRARVEHEEAERVMWREWHEEVAAFQRLQDKEHAATKSIMSDYKKPELDVKQGIIKHSAKTGQAERNLFSEGFAEPQPIYG